LRILGAFFWLTLDIFGPRERKKAVKFKSLYTGALATLAFAVATPASAHGGDESVTTNFEQAIPNIPGKSLVALIVDYPPGGTSVPHTHAQSAFIFAHVISGEIESKVNDGATRIYKAGESWSEPPAASHPVSRNASKSQPARLLAVFVVDSDDRNLTTPEGANK
jgi:quercetin dioxygenase-like cupin family protein